MIWLCVFLAVLLSNAAITPKKADCPAKTAHIVTVDRNGFPENWSVFLPAMKNGESTTAILPERGQRTFECRNGQWRLLS
jgi:hypothetical protein